MKWMLVGALYCLWGHAGHAGENLSELEQQDAQKIAAHTRILTEGVAMSPIEVVNKRMKLYNAHDLEGFLAIYSPDIAIYDYPDTFFGSGIEHMRSIFAPLFVPGGVQAKVLSQLVSDSYVINEEIVTYPDRETRYVSIYEVRDGKIKSVRFVRN